MIVCLNVDTSIILCVLVCQLKPDCTLEKQFYRHMWSPQFLFFYFWTTKFLTQQNWYIVFLCIADMLYSLCVLMHQLLQQFWFMVSSELGGRVYNIDISASRGFSQMDGTIASLSFFSRLRINDNDNDLIKNLFVQFGKSKSKWFTNQFVMEDNMVHWQILVLMIYALMKQ